MKKTISCVLFDLDGTLIDTAPDLVACLNKTLIEYNFEPVSFAEAKKFVYEPFVLGSAIAPAWHTRWFILRGHIPKSWDVDVTTTTVAVHLDLGFIGHYDGFQVEAMLYRDGHPVQAIQPDRRR